jgi:hypothetical protein
VRVRVCVRVRVRVRVHMCQAWMEKKEKLRRQ